VKAVDLSQLDYTLCRY